MSYSCSQADARTFSFGPFTLVPERQLLVKGSAPVRVGVRCLEILTALVERAGQIITKDELISRVWPNTFIEESNLKVNVATLRRVLGDSSSAPRYVATANGRGYRFVAPIESSASNPETGRAVPTPQHNLPMQMTRVVGRADAIRRVSQRIAQHRLVTIAGTGGIGKSTVALSVAREVLNQFENGVWFVDLATLREPGAVAGAVADAMGVAAPTLRTFLKSKHVLLVLDSCEHIVSSVAALADEFIQRTDHVSILATSREPLRVRGEQVYRLPALESPAESNGLTASEALRYPAIELFLDRAAAWAGFQMTDEDAPVVSDICRKLDGVALAIELAAGRVDSLSLTELSAQCDRLTLFSLGRRTAPERHRSLTAALDWGYTLLSESERILLRRLSIFPDAFLLDEACGVAGGDGLSHADFVEGLASLVAKSFVSADIRLAVTQYRLLNTTRAYALQKLRECGEVLALSA